jgi:hypothetical protein
MRGVVEFSFYEWRLNVLNNDTQFVYLNPFLALGWQGWVARLAPPLPRQATERLGET